MIVPLYAHHSSREWTRLLKLPIAGHYVIVNPSDGPCCQPMEVKHWKKLCQMLADKGAKVLIYIDLCRARLTKDKWELKAKSSEDYKLELAAAKQFRPHGLFLDDFHPQNAAHEKAIRWLLRQQVGKMLVGNPGCEIDRSKWPEIEFIEHETNGLGAAANSISLGVQDPPASLGPLSWVTDRTDGRNPYSRLPSYAEKLPW